MDRWNSRFEEVFSGGEWKRFSESLDEVLKDYSTSDEDAFELSRLRKAKVYLEGMINAVDPHLVPPSAFTGVVERLGSAADSLMSYKQGKSGSLLVIANDQMDGVISAFLPFVTLRGLGKSVKGVAKEYAESLAEELPQFRRAFEDESEKIQAELEKAKEKLSEVQRVRDRALEVGLEIYEGDGSILSRALEKMDSISESAKKISEEMDRLYVPSDDAGESIVDAVHSFYDSARKSYSEFVKDKSDSNSIFSKIKDFESYVFGEDVGLKSRLNAYELDQKKRFDTLSEKIQSLMPGAVSAGLASAYYKQKISFDEPIRTSTRLFYSAVGILIVGSLVYLVDSISWSGVSFKQVGDWESVFKSFVSKLPFYGPAVWLAYYASKRRSEFQRLQQEYAHKEALANSFESYRKQVSDLQVRSDELMAQLMQSSIEAISFNASKTLDGVHGDKMPIQDAIDAVMKMRESSSG